MLLKTCILKTCPPQLFYDNLRRQQESDARRREDAKAGRISIDFASAGREAALAAQANGGGKGVVDLTGTAGQPARKKSKWDLSSKAPGPAPSTGVAAADLKRLLAQSGK